MVTRTIVQTFGPWQQGECVSLKYALIAREGQCPGRVPLVDFYSSALNEGKWQFTEDWSYLQALGALDDSDAARPSVIIPNYIEGPSNVIGSSRMHSVVCQDECEDIMGGLERELARHAAPPSEIVTVMETLIAPRKLSEFARLLLDRVAHRHGGQVPLHGRLFSQWLHHVKPQECSYPQRSGTTSPVNPENYWKRIYELRSEMKANVDTLQKSRSNESQVHCPPWSDDEELVAPAEEEAALAAAAVFTSEAWTAALKMAAVVLLFVVIAGMLAATPHLFGRRTAKSRGLAVPSWFRPQAQTPRASNHRPVEFIQASSGTLRQQGEH
jgi:hypothetical protein